MKLSALMKSAEAFGDISKTDPDIGSIHYRAQEVIPGGLFVAVPGFSADGHDYIDEATKRGASAIVAQKSTVAQKRISIQGAVPLEVENSRKALARIAAAFYKNPSKKMTLTGITGTNGKTTTSFLVESILSEAGFNVGVIGTINSRYKGRIFKSETTTPESADLQRIMSDMLKEGATHVVMEVSSHAIDLDRILGSHFDVGVFTNLTRDHLDYHKSMENYWACKKKFFTDFIADGKNSAVVINRGDLNGRGLFDEFKATEKFKCGRVSVGFDGDNMIRPTEFTTDSFGVRGRVAALNSFFRLESKLIGRHNLENILCAVGAGVALNIPLDAIEKGVKKLESAPGRLERIKNDRGLYIYIDYAHTPDALENVLRTLKALGNGAGGGRIVCVFGCGGDRDAQKRPVMGNISGRLSDLSIITSDNPRTEDPGRIIEDIVKGIKKTCPNVYSPGDVKTGFRDKGYVVAPDRRQAVRLAIAASKPGDKILVAGKGHETGQLIRGKVIPFDDRRQILNALRGA